MRRVLTACVFAVAMAVGMVATERAVSARSDCQSMWSNYQSELDAYDYHMEDAAEYWGFAQFWLSQNQPVTAQYWFDQSLTEEAAALGHYATADAIYRDYEQLCY